MRKGVGRGWKVAFATVAGVAIAGVTMAQPIGEGWILGAENDAARFELLQDDAGGFGRAMFEASIRYERLYEALTDGNYELARHHWDTIEASIGNGIVRRPGRAPNAEAIFLAQWETIDAAFESADQATARAAFMTAREACMACHVAEERAYLNDQRLFTDLVFN